ncbi:TonB-dependent receptor [candidate division KSB1 bacterium]|nr:TonB-dependent receptor [candidate division KSB1 bacterium]
MVIKKSKLSFIGIVLLAFLCVAQLVVAQTTGKIAGKITDKESGDPMIGANVVIEGTTLGAAAGPQGEYFIINVSPGTYSLRFQMIGYETVRVENVKVSVNRTTTIDVELKTEVISGEVVVVQAEKVTIKKDQTSSVRNVSSDQIDILPVENVSAVVDMQAGVVEGHFRGGRNTEVSYLIDGVAVTESFESTGRTVDLEPEAIQDLEVITGTFNAEYGNAMSGIVNAVTKDGDAFFSGSASGNFANYYTSHNNIFIGLNDKDVDRNQDYKVQFSGPIWKNKITFFANYRYQNNKNYLNGIDRFNVDDLSVFESDDPNEWYSEHTGDNSYAPMDDDINKSFMGKMTFKLFRNIRTSLLYTWNNDVWSDYNHSYKYNPNGYQSSYRRTNMYSLNINHMLTPRLFYELKLSYIDNFGGWYMYEDPTDGGSLTGFELDENGNRIPVFADQNDRGYYVHDVKWYNVGPGFYTGGQNKDHSRRYMIERKAKFDLTWQVTRRHAIKTGADFTRYHLDNQWSQIRNLYSGTPEEGMYYIDYEKPKVVFPYYIPVTYPDSSVYSDIYQVDPREFSAYIQDKMEFDEMVINVGVRYDYFDPYTTYPSQRRNPSNQLDFPDAPWKMSKDVKADPKIQVSPRFGLSYQLGESALLHFSYGHFFQMPPMQAMYRNNSRRVQPNDYDTRMGNPQIRAQKTVSYEIGLWQEIMKGMGIEVALFYRDIYDLQSVIIISTFNQIEYGLDSNKDYGNVKGLEVKYDYALGHFSALMNYTLQYTRGNADNPTQTFDRAGDNRDPITALIPMSWDQRHTLNLTLGYNTRNYGLTMTGYYNSGAPFTWRPLENSMLARVNLYPNNNWRPSRYTVDLNSYYDMPMPKFDKLKLRWTLTVYNLFDRLNENWVNDQTGRAYTAVIKESNLRSHRSNFNEYIDRVQDPSAYAAPRMVKLGMGVVF